MFPRRFALRAGAWSRPEGSRRRKMATGFRTRSRRSEACDNDWLRLTSDDQRQVRVFDGAVAMRRFLLAAVMFGAASGAQAADLSDLPILRGSFPGGLSTATRNWDGWYVGGQVDYTSSNIDLTHATQTMTSFLLRNSVIQAPVSQLGLFSAQHAQSTGFGAFVGRNF